MGIIERLRNCEVCGQCDRETKTIFAPTWRSGNSGNLLLVHEICHAVSAPHHGMRWKNRMQKVAARAEELGEAELADSIRTEIAHYENSPSYGELVQDVRQQMEYIGMDLNSDFRLVEKNFARELGVSVAEFRKRLPDAKKLFQSGRANALARKERLSRLKQ